MSNNARSRLIALGTVTKPHGLKGEVKLQLYNSAVDILADGDSLRLSGERIEGIYEIESINSKAPKPIAKFKDVNSRNDADILRGATFSLPREDLPELDNGEYYLIDLVGFEVLDEDQNVIGPVIDVYTLPANDIILVKYKAEEVLIPVIKDVVKFIDFEGKIVNIHLMDGLLDQ